MGVIIVRYFDVDRIPYFEVRAIVEAYMDLCSSMQLRARRKHAAQLVPGAAVFVILGGCVGS